MAERHNGRSGSPRGGVRLIVVWLPDALPARRGGGGPQDIFDEALEAHLRAKGF